MAEQKMIHAIESTNLADILERVLDKGIVIARDIKIQLADIDLLNIKIGSPPKNVVGICLGFWRKQGMHLSHEANGIQRNRRPSQVRAARAVWHHRRARVARQRCPILRDGRWNIPIRAGGGKALNPKQLPL